ncbi:MAG TPA: type III-B CRISPR module RAMP protein Cmr1 [Candidatus Aenigmarchaeota archaeon]|nr:type III-B CRISPR module RAMP protein Cmr1 [Candidatus Aenigmarchaeota archaeon]
MFVMRKHIGEVTGMEKLCLELEAVTPIFIAGADQRNIENEGLRPPSLRGLMRWWFRAIMGSMTSIKNLKMLEDRIFGSTNQKSAIRVTSVTNAKPSTINIPNSLRYLWFSIQLQRRQNQRLQCYPEKSKFHVTIYSEDKNVLNIVSGCLWTLIYLGGIGSRMRRGAGSLKVVKIFGDTPYRFIFEGKTVVDAKKFIEINLKKIFENFKEYVNGNFSLQRSPSFAVLSKRHSEIKLINKTFNTSVEALKEVSDKYQIFRRGKPLKHRYTFGLPIISHREFKDRRQASPIFIGVMDLNGKYSVRLIKFYTSIHPDFSKYLRFLSQDLNNFDNKIANELGEINVEIPELR